MVTLGYSFNRAKVVQTMKMFTQHTEKLHEFISKEL